MDNSTEMLKVPPPPRGRADEHEEAQAGFPAPSHAVSPAVPPHADDVESERPTQPPPATPSAETWSAPVMDTSAEDTTDSVPPGEEPPGSASAVIGPVGRQRSRSAASAATRALIGIAGGLLLVTLGLLVWVVLSLGRLEESAAAAGASQDQLQAELKALGSDVEALKASVEKMKSALPDARMRREISKTATSVAAVERQVKAWADAEAQQQQAEAQKAASK